MLATGERYHAYVEHARFTHLGMRAVLPALWELKFGNMRPVAMKYICRAVDIEATAVAANVHRPVAVQHRSWVVAAEGRQRLPRAAGRLGVVQEARPRRRLVTTIADVKKQV